MILTNEERNKFHKYLLECIESDKLVLKQMDNIQIVDTMKRMYKNHIAAKQLVADWLFTAESQVIK